MPFAMPALRAFSSPKTCGWRRIIFSVIACTTSPKAKSPSLLGHPGVVDDLQQQVAEFVAQIVEIAARDGVGHLVGFLDRVGRDRREILLDVPGAPGIGRAQRRHDLDQAGNVAGRLHAPMLAVAASPRYRQCRPRCLFPQAPFNGRTLFACRPAAPLPKTQAFLQVLTKQAELCRLRKHPSTNR